MDNKKRKNILRSIRRKKNADTQSIESSYINIAQDSEQSQEVDNFPDTEKSQEVENTLDTEQSQDNEQTKGSEQENFNQEDLKNENLDSTETKDTSKEDLDASNESVEKEAEKETEKEAEKDPDFFKSDFPWQSFNNDKDQTNNQSLEKNEDDIRIVFHANGGFFPLDEKHKYSDDCIHSPSDDNGFIYLSKTQKKMTPFIPISTKPKRKWFIFTGWRTAKEKGNPVNKKTILSNEETVVLYANWLSVFSLAGLIASIIAVILLAILAFNMCMRWLDPAQEMTTEEIDANLKEKMSEAQMLVDVSSKAEFYDGSTNPTKFTFRNSGANKLDQKMTIYIDGEVVYESNGAIQPGYELKSIALNKKLDPGVYNATAEIKGYKRDNHEQLGGATIDINIVVH